MYEIEIKPNAEKDLRAIDKKDAVRILEKLLSLENGLSGDIKKLTNFSPEYRLRIGNYRALFEIDGNSIIIYRVLHRQESYK